MPTNKLAIKNRTNSTSSAYSSCSDDYEYSFGYSQDSGCDDNHKIQMVQHPVDSLLSHKRYSDNCSIITKHFDKSSLPKLKRVRSNSSTSSLSDPAIFGDNYDSQEELDEYLEVLNSDKSSPDEAFYENCDKSMEMDDLGVAFQKLFMYKEEEMFNKAGILANACHTIIPRKSVTFSESVQKSFFRSGDVINRCRRKMHKEKLKGADECTLDNYREVIKKEVHPSTKNKGRRRKNKKINL